MRDRSSDSSEASEENGCSLLSPTPFCHRSRRSAFDDNDQGVTRLDRTHARTERAPHYTHTHAHAMVERAVAAAPRAHWSACELRRCSAAALRTAQRVPTLKTSGCPQGRGKMQKKYKTKVLSLGTWPTKGPGFRLAVDAWRAFTAGLEPLEQEDVPAHDDRVTQLVAAAQQAARQVRLDPACTQPNPTLPSPLPSPHTTPQPPSETILRLLLLLTLSPPSACPQPIISMPSACPQPILTRRSPYAHRAPRIPSPYPTLSLSP